MSRIIRITADEVVSGHLIFLSGPGFATRWNGLVTFITMNDSRIICESEYLIALLAWRISEKPVKL